MMGFDLMRVHEKIMDMDVGEGVGMSEYVRLVMSCWVCHLAVAVGESNRAAPRNNLLPGPRPGARQVTMYSTTRKQSTR
ncbi:hypothetical protein E2C01_034488 [Portunus trituberculatus]|uniref:Uncharacterized protein n=1 Tax=Portunus trituberculatus TaxID=210409 RepID=A0A5B7F8N1_PORTR|nr:hypothetical protein [Portunus trituberculatus]